MAAYGSQFMSGMLPLFWAGAEGVFYWEGSKGGSPPQPDTSL